MPRIFAYGSLGFPGILLALTGRRFSSRSAVLEGFARYRVRGESHPGIVPVPGARTAGVLYSGVDRRSLALLDRFEGDLYERREVRVRAGDGPPLRAMAYVVAPGRRRCLARQPWDRDRFAARHLASWRAHCARLRRATRVR